MKETMARLYEYLGNARKDENVRRNCCNDFTVIRYVQISRAFSTIKECSIT